MAVAISHQSALDVIRLVRAEGTNLNELDVVTLVSPSAWQGKHWGVHNFDPEQWRWGRPNAARPLHVLTTVSNSRIRSRVIRPHSISKDLPAGSVLWLDEHSSVVCPELLFLQMSETLSFPMLVLLGYELCGHFARAFDNPLGGAVTEGLPSATNVERIGDYLSKLKGFWGLVKARQALHYIADHAVSAPEAVLATMYSLPTSESGYGMGPVTLNDSVDVDDVGDRSEKARRFPDLRFPFAPIGINYDGEGHLDLLGLVAAAQTAILADEESADSVQQALADKLSEVRAKALDDNMRNRQLAAKGLMVFPVTKEDLYGVGHLDDLTAQMLSCARQVFGVDTTRYENTLTDTDLKRDRQALLDSMLPQGCFGAASYGVM